MTLDVSAALEEQLSIGDHLYDVLAEMWAEAAHLMPEEVAFSVQWAMVRYLRDRGMEV